MNKNFYFCICAMTDRIYFFQTQLARQNNTFHTGFSSKLNTLGISNRHLRTGMQRQVRHYLPGQTDHTQILYDNTVDAHITQKQQIISQFAQLTVIDQRVDSDIQSHTVHMSKVNSLLHFFTVKITGILTCAKSFAAHIYSISTGIHRRFQRFPAPGRSEQFDGLLFH